eukprot:206108-Alexandrium_andersonii.AAC.1
MPRTTCAEAGKGLCHDPTAPTVIGFGLLICGESHRRPRRLRSPDHPTPNDRETAWPFRG